VLRRAHGPQTLSECYEVSSNDYFFFFLAVFLAVFFAFFAFLAMLLVNRLPERNQSAHAAYDY
jgi:hypothetical protein